MVCRQCNARFDAKQVVESLHWPRGQTPPSRLFAFAAICGALGAAMLVIALRFDVWQLGLLSGAPLLGSVFAVGHAIVACYDYGRVRCPNCGEPVRERLGSA